MEDDLAMQPLLRVRPEATTHWGHFDTLTSRPTVAVKVAQCISEWAEIETMLGMTLGILLDTDSKAALAMYAAADSRAAQLRILSAAAETKLTPFHHDVFTVLMQLIVKPVMGQRDKLAHWCWGFCSELPDDLLLAQPDRKTTRQFAAAHRNPEDELVPYDGAGIFVITEAYLGRLAKEMRAANAWVAEFGGSVWAKNTPQERAEHLQKLSNEPRIQSGLIRLNERRKNDPAAPPPSPESELSG